MAKEVLYVPEERLTEVIAIIRAGMAALADDPKISAETREGLTTWCDEEEEYWRDPYHEKRRETHR